MIPPSATSLASNRKQRLNHCPRLIGQLTTTNHLTMINDQALEDRQDTP